MDDVLTVQTAFADIAELAQGYVGRVTAQQLVVSVGQPVEAGTAVRFQLLLADGTLAFWGDGHCAQVVDNGDGAAEHERYELVLHSLAFPDERSLPVFEYLVSLSETATPSGELTASEDATFASIEPGASEVGTDEIEPIDAAEMDVAPEIERGDAAESPAMIDDVPFEDEVPRALSDRPGPPASPMLTRMATGNAWRPVRPEKQQPAARSGLFKYNFGELPTPAHPPRPELDPSLRVKPAARPAAQPE